MARANVPQVEGAPTMIIPNGTKIEVDDHGQLSIRTPGNLVIQNSGSYGTIESASGSIRIEPNVQVEAVNVQCADVCYVQGSLTAWKVTARSIELDESARAHIILQETDQLQIGRQARLVGNFSSEKELFLLLSRFAKQLKGMPFYNERRTAVPEELLAAAVEQGTANALESGGTDSSARPEVSMAAGDTNTQSRVAATGEPDNQPSSEKPESQDLPDDLFFALVLLERESGRSGNGPTSQKAVEDLVRLLRRRALSELRDSYRSAFSRIVEPGEDIKRARELIHAHFNPE